MTAEDAALVYTEAEYVREIVEGDRRVELSRFSPYSHIDYSLEKLHAANFIPVNTWAHRRELLRLAGDFDISLNALEDWDLLLRYSRLTEPIHIPKLTAEVRLRPDSVKDNMTQTEQKDFPKLFRKIYARSLSNHVVPFRL